MSDQQGERAHGLEVPGRSDLVPEAGKEGPERRRGRGGVGAEGRGGGREGSVEGRSQDRKRKARKTEKGGGGKEYKGKP